MPTEHELKYVMIIDDDLEDEISDLSDGKLFLSQGYIHRKSKLSVRVRSQHNLANDTKRYFLQTKLKVKRTIDTSKLNKDLSNYHECKSDCSRIVEISQEISLRDYLDFWQFAQVKLNKCRYLIKSDISNDYFDCDNQPWQEVWEIDFFKLPPTFKHNYFVLAECELPEGVQSPLFEIPEIIRKNTVFRVPLWDSRFSSSKLGNAKYAAQIYDSLLEEK